MWTTGTLPSSSSSSRLLWPFTGKQGPFTVSASPSSSRWYSRPRKNININNINYDHEEEEERLNQEETWKEDIGDLEVEEEQPKISGSVVLLALQKASAHKKTTKIKKKKNKTTTKTTIKEDATSSSDYSSHVKPLCIKPHWKDRLDELETHLHHLIHNHT